MPSLLEEAFAQQAKERATNSTLLDSIGTGVSGANTMFQGFNQMVGAANPAQFATNAIARAGAQTGFNALGVGGLNGPISGGIGGLVSGGNLLGLFQSAINERRKAGEAEVKKGLLLRDLTIDHMQANGQDPFLDYSADKFEGLNFSDEAAFGEANTADMLAEEEMERAIQEYREDNIDVLANIYNEVASGGPRPVYEDPIETSWEPTDNFIDSTLPDDTTLDGNLNDPINDPVHEALLDSIRTAMFKFPNASPERIRKALDQNGISDKDYTEATGRDAPGAPTEATETPTEAPTEAPTETPTGPTVTNVPTTGDPIVPPGGFMSDAPTPPTDLNDPVKVPSIPVGLFMPQLPPKDLNNIVQPEAPVAALNPRRTTDLLFADDFSLSNNIEPYLLNRVFGQRTR